MILTDEEIFQLDFDLCNSLRLKENQLAFARAIEREVLRKLRERPADGLLVETDGGPMYWPAVEIEEARLYCDDTEPAHLHIIPEANE